MTFSNTVSRVVPNVIGDKKVSYGTFKDSGSSGGDIDTNLRVCDIMFLTRKGGTIIRQVTGQTSSISTANPLVNETFPVGGTAVTIVCSTNDEGYWLAYGYD